MKYLLSCLLLITLTACLGEDDGVHKGLPDATQEGLGTFGCYVNGELFVETGSYFNTYYQYNPQEDKYVFHLTAGDDDERLIISTISIAGNDVILQPSRNSLSCYEPQNWEGQGGGGELSIFYLATTCDSNGWLEITKHSDGILSGEFEMDLIDPRNGNVITVRDGRFDTLITY
jgi:hypothetical protein